MKYTNQAADLIKGFEGLRLDAYKDPAGVWTIGYGHTSTAGPGQRITKDQALSLLRSDMDKALNGVNNALRPEVSSLLSSSQVDALTSFVFNVGTGAFQRSTMAKKINERRPDQEVADEFGRWVYAGGSVLPGLVKRREKESAVYLGSSKGGFVIAVLAFLSWLTRRL